MDTPLFIAKGRATGILLINSCRFTLILFYLFREVNTRGMNLIVEAIDICAR
jgi:hypothetical protein